MSSERDGQETPQQIGMKKWAGALHDHLMCRQCREQPFNPCQLGLIRVSRAALWRIAKARSTVKAATMREIAKEALLIPRRLGHVTKEVQAARKILARNEFILSDEDFKVVQQVVKGANV
ncbi:MAG TPA: hypothetical protein VI386_17785 [Candidatus Sulfotelmatobacter sp.]